MLSSVTHGYNNIEDIITECNKIYFYAIYSV